MSDDTVRATFHVIIEPVRSQFGERPVKGANAVRLTKGKPVSLPTAEAVVVKLSVDIPKSVFEPFAPEAIVTIPASMVMQQAIEVTAVEPDA